MLLLFQTEPPFFFSVFFPLISRARTSKTVLNNCRESGSSCLFPYLREIAFFYMFQNNVYWGFVICGLYYVKINSFHVHLLKRFYHKWILEFVKSFFWIYLDYPMVFIFQVLILCFTIINSSILKNTCIPGINVTWSWCMIFLMCCWFLLAKFFFFFWQICISFITDICL